MVEEPRTIVATSKYGIDYYRTAETIEAHKQRYRELMGLSPDIPLDDATEGIDIEVESGMEKVCDPHSPDSCVLSASWRLSGHKILRVLIWRSFAVVVYKDRAVRYELSKAARQAVDQYDRSKGKKFPPGVYRFGAPSIGHTLGVKYDRENSGNGGSGRSGRSGKRRVRVIEARNPRLAHVA